MSVQESHHHRLAAPEPEAEAKRQHEQRRRALRERKQQIDRAGDEQRDRQHLLLGESPRDPRHQEPHDERRAANVDSTRPISDAESPIRAP